MAARETMADLIARLRALVGDPAGDDQAFDDEDLQMALDGRRADQRYLELTPLATIAEGGGVTHIEYAALLRREWRHGLGLGSPIGDWEEGATLYGPDFAEVEPESGDWARGRWTFEAHQPGPVSIVGSSYDPAAAGADVLEMWAARVKGECDIRSGDQAVARGTQAARMLVLAVRLRRRSRVAIGHIVRSDTC
jgi:hypothetical protein